METYELALKIKIVVANEDVAKRAVRNMNRVAYHATDGLSSDDLQTFDSLGTSYQLVTSTK